MSNDQDGSPTSKKNAATDDTVNESPFSKKKTLTTPSRAFKGINDNEQLGESPPQFREFKNRSSTLAPKAMKSLVEKIKEN